MSPPGSEGAGGVVAMTPEVLGALEGLRDLQLDGPPYPSWTFGTVTIGLVLVAVLLAWIWWRHPNRAALRRFRQLHADMRANPSGGAASRLAVESLNHILRAEALRSDRSDPMPPGLSGGDWLRWLDDRAPPPDRGVFVAGAGRLLAELPFAPPDAKVDPAELEALFALAARWLKHVGATRGRRRAVES
jgi:hypothetical protein